MNKIALITGATAGIGKATAKILANNGFDVIITGRRKDRLRELANELQKETNAKTQILSFDVRIQKQVVDAIDSLPKKWQQIDLLVNNAGLALGFSTIDAGETDHWDTMIDTNVKGLLYVSRKIMPKMVARKSGQIINIASIAGKEVYSNGNVYCATKHAVDAITKAMRIDMLKHGIKVTSICPGMVETEFSVVRYDGNEEKAASVYDGLIPLYANDIAEAVLFTATRPPHVNVNDMLIMPTAQASAAHTLRK